eukprot:Clim_evm95s147 gene=Clim_evmTU95s147
MDLTFYYNDRDCVIQLPEDGSGDDLLEIHKVLKEAFGIEEDAMLMLFSKDSQLEMLQEYTDFKRWNENGVSNITVKLKEPDVDSQEGVAQDDVLAQMQHQRMQQQLHQKAPPRPPKQDSVTSIEVPSEPTHIPYLKKRTDSLEFLAQGKGEAPNESILNAVRTLAVKVNTVAGKVAYQPFLIDSNCFYRATTYVFMERAILTGAGSQLANLLNKVKWMKEKGTPKIQQDTFEQTSFILNTTLKQMAEASKQSDKERDNALMKLARNLAEVWNYENATPQLHHLDRALMLMSRGLTVNTIAANLASRYGFYLNELENMQQVMGWCLDNILRWDHRVPQPLAVDAFARALDMHILLLQPQGADDSGVVLDVSLFGYQGDTKPQRSNTCCLLLVFHSFVRISVSSDGFDRLLGQARPKFLTPQEQQGLFGSVNGQEAADDGEAQQADEISSLHPEDKSNPMRKSGTSVENIQTSLNSVDKSTLNLRDQNTWKPYDKVGPATSEPGEAADQETAAATPPPLLRSATDNMNDWVTQTGNIDVSPESEDDAKAEAAPARPPRRKGHGNSENAPKEVQSSVSGDEKARLRKSHPLGLSSDHILIDDPSNALGEAVHDDAPLVSVKENTNSNSDTVTISKKEYEELLEKVERLKIIEDQLNALKALTGGK